MADIAKIVADVAKADEALRLTYIDKDTRDAVLVSIFRGAYSA